MSKEREVSREREVAEAVIELCAVVAWTEGTDKHNPQSFVSPRDLGSMIARKLRLLGDSKEVKKILGEEL